MAVLLVLMFHVDQGRLLVSSYARLVPTMPACVAQLSELDLPSDTAGRASCTPLQRVLARENPPAKH